LIWDLVILVTIGIYLQFEHIWRIDFNYEDLIQKNTTRFEIDFFLIWDFCNSIFKKPIPIMTFAYLGKTECMNHRSDLMPKLHHTN